MKYATLVYLESNGQILVVEKGGRAQDPNSHRTVPPGGKIDPGETPLQCAIRETQEETGITPKNLSLVGTILYDNTERIFPGGRTLDSFFVYIFYGTEFNGTLKETKNSTKLDESERPLWKDISAFVLGLTEDGEKLVHSAVKSGKKFSGQIYHIGNELSKEKTNISYFE